MSNGNRNFDDILNSIRAGIVVFRVTGPQMSVIAVNDYMCETMEMEREMFLRADKADIMEPVFPEDEPAVAEFIESLAAGDGAEKDIEYRVYSFQNRRLMWFRVKGSSRCDADGSYVMYFVYLEITDQKRNEDDYNRNVQQMLQANPAVRCAFHLNLSRNLCVEKRGAYEYTKHLMDANTADELIENIARIIIDPGKAEKFRAEFGRETLLRDYAEGKRQFSIVYRRLTEGGNALWVKTFFQLMLSPATSDIEAVAYTEDYEKEHLENSILSQITADDYEAIGTVNLATQDVQYYFIKGEYVGDDPEFIESFDKRAEALYEATRSEYEKQLAKEQISIPRIIEQLQTAPKANISFFIEGKYEQLVYRYLDESHEKLLFTRRDVTEAMKEREDNEERIRRALYEAEVASSAKTEFVSRISHDIRTPIGAILNLTEFAKEDMDDREKLSEDIDKIGTSGRFLLSLINDVLDIAKIDSGKTELHPEPYSFREYISEIRNIMEPMCEQKGIRSVFDIGYPPNDYAMLDKIRMNQITLNILSNAVKYTPRGGEVIFRTQFEAMQDDKMSFLISVEDNGIGMSREFLEVIYDEFAQETSNPLRNTADVSSGTGLGIPIVKKLLDLMSGEINIQSELGKGTTVNIRLLLEGAEDPSKGEGQQGDAEETVEGKILFAEDNEINAAIAERIFEEIGVVPDHAENGREAVEKFSTSAPGTYKAIFMDIQMPLMNGYEATEAIRALDREDAKTIPVIAMTADAFADAMDKAKAAGMTEFTTKPLNPEELRRLLLKYSPK